MGRLWGGLEVGEDCETRVEDAGNSFRLLADLVINLHVHTVLDREDSGYCDKV